MTYHMQDMKHRLAELQRARDDREEALYIAGCIACLLGALALGYFFG
jgi:hypothetical protein